VPGLVPSFFGGFPWGFDRRFAPGDFEAFVVWQAVRACFLVVDEVFQISDGRPGFLFASVGFGILLAPSLAPMLRTSRKSCDFVPFV
jgi:hypothetical protein